MKEQQIITVYTVYIPEEQHFIAVYFPDGCTWYVQPMDIILNKLVKGKITHILEEWLEVVEEIHDSVGHRRILITQAVAGFGYIQKKKTLLLSLLNK